MEKVMVRYYIGKKCLIVLKNNYSYTAVIPQFDGTAFTIVDRFGESVSIDCDFIVFVREVEE